MFPNAQFHASQVPVYIGKIMEVWKRSDLKACCVEKEEMGTVEGYFLPKYKWAAMTRRSQSFFGISHFPILYCLTKNYSDLSNGMLGLCKEGRHFRYWYQQPCFQLPVLSSAELGNMTALPQLLQHVWAMSFSPGGIRKTQHFRVCVKI